MGLEQAGMEVVYQCEIEKKCQSVLKRHWPDVPLHDDVSTLTGKMVLDAVGSVDVVAWGSPCQDLSIAGGRSGLEGNKSGLFHEGIRIIKELREESNNEYPRWSIWENVRGAFSSNNGRDFGTVIDQMAEAGAVEIEWRLLDAQFFGVPQRRKRVFVVAGFHPRADDSKPVFALTESVRRNPSTSAKEREEIAGTLGLGFGARGSDIDEMTFIPPIATAVCARYAKGPGQTVDPGQVLVTPFVKSRRAQSTEDYETWVADAPSPTLNAFDNATETRATVIVPVAFDSNWSGRYDVMDSNLSPTIKSTQPPPAVAFDEYNFSTDDTHHSLRAGTKQSTGVVEMAVRRLTPRECERLMGWPDDHTLLGSDGKEITDGHRYKMCGNGVVSSVAKWVGEQVMRVNG